MGEEEETGPFSKKKNLFLNGRWALESFYLRKNGSLYNSRLLLPLVEDVTSWYDGRRWEEYFEESKGKVLIWVSDTSFEESKVKTQ